VEAQQEAVQETDQHHHQRRKKARRQRRRENMVTLSWWEQMIIGSAISFLIFLEGRIKNPTELAALRQAVAFLQKLLSGNLSMEA
jgi:hypothetical protein